MSWSHVTISGHVVRAPRRRTRGGKVVSHFGIEVVNTIVNGSGEQEQVRNSIEVACFNGLADHVHTSVRAGTRVVATGLLGIRTWERNTGGRGSSIDLIATDVGVSLRAATAVVTPQERLEVAS